MAKWQKYLFQKKWAKRDLFSFIFVLFSNTNTNKAQIGQKIK